jgi:benzylsuccinate CoA-transferase BbsE subunit
MNRIEKEDHPLTGIRILDLADEKGSFCSKLLADLGAYVLKVEKPGGDSSRMKGPFWGDAPDPEKSLFFSYHNTNKLGITLNLEHPEGKEIFGRLLKTFDIVVESFHPGYLKNLGVGFEFLSEINPQIILVSITGFGQSGPQSQYKSCDLVASASGGQMYGSGPASTPLKPFGEQSFHTASLFAAIGIMLALRKRVQSKKGTHIDISLQEAVASTLDHVMVRYFYERVIPQRQGSLHWDHSFAILPCKDGSILMTPLQQWETLVEWMDGEGMAEDLKEEKYRQEEYRRKTIVHIMDVIQRWTRTHTTQELFELGQLMHFPWAPVHLPMPVWDSPQLKARQFFVDVNHPEMGSSFPYPGTPYKNMALPSWKRAPMAGEDNVQVYQKLLGLSDQEIKRLSSGKVI